MSKSTKTVLILIGILMGTLFYLWLASFLFRLGVSMQDVGGLKGTIKTGFHLTDKIRSTPLDIIVYQIGLKEIYPKQLRMAWLFSGILMGAIVLLVAKALQRTKFL